MKLIRVLSFHTSDKLTFETRYGVMCLLHFGGMAAVNSKPFRFPRGESPIYDARFLVAVGPEHEKSARRRENSRTIISVSECGFGCRSEGLYKFDIIT